MLKVSLRRAPKKEDEWHSAKYFGWSITDTLGKLAWWCNVATMPCHYSIWVPIGPEWNPCRALVKSRDTHNRILLTMYIPALSQRPIPERIYSVLHHDLVLWLEISSSTPLLREILGSNPACLPLRLSKEPNDSKQWQTKAEIRVCSLGEVIQVYCH